MYTQVLLILILINIINSLLLALKKVQKVKITVPQIPIKWMKKKKISLLIKVPHHASYWGRLISLLPLNGIWKTLWIICLEWYMYISVIVQIMNSFQAYIFFYTLWNRQKTCNFLMLSWVIEGKQCRLEWKNV